MRWFVIIGLLLVYGCKIKKNQFFLQTEEVQLSKPILRELGYFFEDQTSVEFLPVANAAKIEYLISNQSGIKGPIIYNDPIHIDQTSKIEFKAVSDELLESEVIEREFIKLSELRIDSISSKRSLSEAYPGGGLSVLTDRNKGSFNFRENSWLGYSGGTLPLKLKFKSQVVSRILVSTLVDQQAWIFSPNKIEVFGDGTLLGITMVKDVNKEKNSQFEFLYVDIPPTLTDQLEVLIKCEDSIPEWHPGAGNKPWLFVDEVMVYSN